MKLTKEQITEFFAGLVRLYKNEPAVYAQADVDAMLAIRDLALQALEANRVPTKGELPEFWSEQQLKDAVHYYGALGANQIAKLQSYIAALPRSEPKVDVCSVCHREVGAGQHVCFDPSPIAALPRSEPKEAGDEYEGDTAKGWYEAWNRENDAWQKMVQHHEELEEAVKVMLKDGMKPTEYLEAMEKVHRILAIEGSAPAKSAPEAEGVRALVKAIKEAAWYRGTEGGMDRDWEENAEGVEPIALDATEIWPAYQAVKAALGDL